MKSIKEGSISIQKCRNRAAHPYGMMLLGLGQWCCLGDVGLRECWGHGDGWQVIPRAMHGRTTTQHKAFSRFVQLSRVRGCRDRPELWLCGIPGTGLTAQPCWGQCASHLLGVSQPPGHCFDVQPQFGYELAWVTCRVCTNLASSQWDGNWGCASDLWGFCAPVATSEGLVCLPCVASWPGSRA